MANNILWSGELRICYCDQSRIEKIKELFGSHGHPARNRLERRLLRQGKDFSIVERQEKFQIPQRLSDVPQARMQVWRSRRRKINSCDRQLYVQRCYKQRWKSFSVGFTMSELLCYFDFQSPLECMRSLRQVRKVFLRPYRELANYWDLLPCAEVPSKNQIGVPPNLNCSSHNHSQYKSNSSGSRATWKSDGQIPLQFDLPFHNSPPPLIVAVNYLECEVAKQDFTPTSVELKLSRHFRLLWDMWQRLNPKHSSVRLFSIKPKFIENDEDKFHIDLLPLTLPAFDQLPNSFRRHHIHRYIRQIKTVTFFYEPLFSDFKQSSINNNRTHSNSRLHDNEYSNKQPIYQHSYQFSERYSIQKCTSNSVIKLTVLDPQLSKHTSSLNAHVTSLPLLNTNVPNPPTKLSSYLHAIVPTIQFTLSDVFNLSRIIRSMQLPQTIQIILESSLIQSALHLIQLSNLRKTNNLYSNSLSSFIFDYTGISFQIQEIWTLYNSLNDYVQLGFPFEDPQLVQQLFKVYT